MYAVTTQTAAYLINRDEGWIQRVPDTPDDDNYYLVAALRKDGERIPLISMEEPEVGKPMLMLLDVVQDGVTSTSRLTTPVREIIDLDGKVG